MWIFKALIKALRGNDGYEESNEKVNQALLDEHEGKDITPKED